MGLTPIGQVSVNIPPARLCQASILQCYNFRIRVCLSGTLRLPELSFFYNLQSEN